MPCQATAKMSFLSPQASPTCARQQGPMTCVCPCPAGPRGFVPAAKLRPYSPVQVQQPGMQLLTLDSGTERRRHSYASPEAPRPQVATFTPTFQVRVGDIPGAIPSNPTSSLLVLEWVGRWTCFSRCPSCWDQGGQGKRTVLGGSPVPPPMALLYCPLRIACPATSFPL